MPVEDRTLGAWHLADNPDLYEIQRTNNFEFVVTGLDNLLRPSVSEDSAGAYIKNAQEVLRISVLEASIPHFTQNVIEIKRGNTTIKAAGTPTYDSGTLRLYDFIGADTKSALMAWQALSFNEGTEKVGKMSAYKKDCELVEYAPDNTIVRYWILKGCWISGIDEDNHSFDNSDRKTITATITYDKAQIRLPD